jgi:Leucine-rich repeat (LRR) protein
MIMISVTGSTMARFDDLPDKTLLKIFSYLSIKDVSMCVRNVCTRWRAVSEDEVIWKDWGYFPDARTPEEDLILAFEHFPELRKFRYYGTCNVVEKLSEYCRKTRVVHVPHIKLSADVLKLTMKRLTELRELVITISPTQDGLELTRIIGLSKSLESLYLRSSGENTVVKGLLKPIADGCPNLNTLKCENFNCPNSEIYYLMKCKKHQLVVYRHYGVVSADLIKAINECPNLTRLAFIGANFDGPFQQIPPITNLQNLSVLELARCRFPMLKIIPLTIFLDTLPRLNYIGISYTKANIDDITNKIILKCPLLTHLDLEGNEELRCRGFRNIRFCKMLKYLDVSNSKEIGTKAIKYVAEGCPELQHLDVSGIPISDSMFRQILRCRNLKTLFMKDCDLTRINLKLISTNISGLLRLYIGPHFQLQNEVKNEMRQQMRNLTITQASAELCSKEYSKLKGQHVVHYL